jgi:hypothetical protein
MRQRPFGIAGDWQTDAKWLDAHKIKHIRGAPYHPMTHTIEIRRDVPR